MESWKTDKFVALGRAIYQQSAEMSSNASKAVDCNLSSLYCIACDQLFDEFDDHKVIQGRNVSCPSCGVTDIIYPPDFERA